MINFIKRKKSYNIKRMLKYSMILLLLSLFYIIFFNTNIMTSGGEAETAYVTWNDTIKIPKYHVYIRNIETNEAYQVEDALIRKYQSEDKTYWRADVLGLTAGKYRFEIVPVIDNHEIKEITTVTDILTVVSHNREGFAFAKNSINGGNASGGYLENGTIPQDAKIIYITRQNVNTVSLEINKATGEKIVVKGLSEILSNWQEEAIAKHLIIRILGKLERNDIIGLEENYQSIYVKHCEGVTIEGVGNDATLKGVGIIIAESSDIEIRNLGFMLFYEDGIDLEKDNAHIWIHHNDFYYGQNGLERERDKVKGDGSTDIKKSQYITISYNHYWDSGKTSVCGVLDDLNYITYHHNWFDHCDSRCPRVNYASVHVYNNYYIGNSKYSIGAANGASVFAEANLFKYCMNPFMISGQGSDVIRNAMSAETGGMIKAYRNLFIGDGANIIFSNKDPIQFDAYLTYSREEEIPMSYKTYKGEYTYNNFDIDTEIMYSYMPDEPIELMQIVEREAGRVEGGDIIFDTSMLNNYSNSRFDIKEKELDEMLNQYETNLCLDTLNI